MPNSDKLTYIQLMQRVDSDIKAEIGRDFGNAFSQTPQLEGSTLQKERMLFQTSARSAIPRQPLVPPHLNVSSSRSGKVELNAGSDQGVTPGSEYFVHAGKIGDFHKPTGKIRVLDVQKDRAIAEVINGRAIKSGDAAVETRHKEPAGKKGAFTIRVEGNGAEASEMERALRKTGLVEISPDKPTLLLQVEKQEKGLVAKLYRMEGMSRHEKTPMSEVSAASIDTLATQVGQAIQNLSVMRSLITLNNPNPGFSLKIDTEKSLFSVGDEIKLTMEAFAQSGASVDCYVTLIDIDANGAPRIIFPIKDSPVMQLRDNHMKKEERRVFYVKANLPAGQETLIALASRRPSDWSSALLPSQMKKGSGDYTKGLELVRTEIQDTPLEEWAKSIATFVIVEQADLR